MNQFWQKVDKYLLILFSVGWGFGTNLELEGYYITKGLSINDIVFIIYSACTILLIKNIKYRDFSKSLKLIIQLLLALFTLMSISTIINMRGYNDIIFLTRNLRIIYFILLIITCSQYIRKSGCEDIILGYIFGASIIVLLKFYPFYELRLISGIPIVKDPNVVGGVLFFMALFSFIGLVNGYIEFLLIFILIATISITTYSKGYWIIVTDLVGMYIFNIKNIIANRKFVFNIFIKSLLIILTLLFCIIPWISNISFKNDINYLVNHKIKTTNENESALVRIELLKQGGEIVSRNFLFGVGNNYNKILIETPSFDGKRAIVAYDNSHNVFSEISIIYGMPTLLTFIAIILYSSILFRDFLYIYFKSFYIVYILVILYTFAIVLHGLIQIQIIIQPSFYIFIAILIGLINANTIKNYKQ